MFPARRTPRGARTPAPSVRPPGRPLRWVVVVFFVLVFAAVVFGIVEVVLFVIILRQNDPTVVEVADGLRLALEPLLQIAVRRGRGTQPRAPKPS